MNKTLLETLTDAMLGMGLTEDDVPPLADLTDCLVELDLDVDGAEVNRGTHGREQEGEERA